MRLPKGLDEAIIEIADVSEILDRNGFALMIVKKPKKNGYTYMYDPKREIIVDKTRFGATRVRELREKMGMKVSDMAKDMGVDRHIIMRMENDKLRHTYDSMKKFADYFCVSVEELVKTDDD